MLISPYYRPSISTCIFFSLSSCATQSGWWGYPRPSGPCMGSVIGGLLFPRLADIHGRRKILLFCIWTNTVIGIITASSPSYVFYCVLRFLEGSLLQVWNHNGLCSSLVFYSMLSRQETLYLRVSYFMPYVNHRSVSVTSFAVCLMFHKFITRNHKI